MESLLQLFDIVLYYKCLNIPPSLLIEIYLSPINSCIHYFLEVILIWKVQPLPLTNIKLLSFILAARAISKGTTRHERSCCLHYKIVLTLTGYHEEMLLDSTYLNHLLTS